MTETGHTDTSAAILKTRHEALDWASERIRATGLPTAVSNDLFESFLSASNMSRSKFYRAWNQASFTEALIDHLIEQPWAETTIFHSTALLDAVRFAVEHEGDLKSEDDRRRLLLKAVRVGIESDLEKVSGTKNWRTPIDLRGTIHSIHDTYRRDELFWQIREIDFNSRHRAAQYVRIALNLFGFRLEESLQEDYSVIPAVASAILNGLLLEAEKNDTLLSFRKIRADFPGESPYCSIAALTCTSFVDQVIRPVPEDEFDIEATIEVIERIRQTLETSTDDPTHRVTMLRRVLIAQQ